jgi:hypothetical protein
MKRTQVQLEEELYSTLRERAYREHSSVASVIRTMLRECTQPGVVCRTPKKTLKSFSFVGAGASRGKGAGTISQRHDEELARAYDIC